MTLKTDRVGTQSWSYTIRYSPSTITEFAIRLYARDVNHHRICLQCIRYCKQECGDPELHIKVIKGETLPTPKDFCPNFIRSGIATYELTLIAEEMIRRSKDAV